MIDLFLTDEENEFHQQVRNFVAAEIAPHAAVIDREDRVPDEVRKEGSCPRRKVSNSSKASR